jgi:hypothetical protein
LYPLALLEQPGRGVTEVDDFVVEKMGRDFSKPFMRYTCLPKSLGKSRSFAQTMQWIGLSGVFLIVHTGYVLFRDCFGVHSKHSVACVVSPSAFLSL